VRTRPMLRASAAAAALSLVLAACGQDTEQATETEDTTESAPEADDPDAADEPADEPTDDEEPTEADVVFIRGMVPHHEGAVEMARLVPDRTDREELRELADEIVQVQEAEIDHMEGMLERMEAHDMSADGGHGMDDEEMGMMSDEDMARLHDAHGEEFDRHFLDSMIEHHEGAIRMAEQVLAEGSDDEVAALAEDVIAAQEAEIARMREWQEEWGLT
jgi:uncharacterized protein (DUF305 family)